MMNNNIITFKEQFKKFKEAIEYIEKNMESLKNDPERMNKIRSNFKRKFEIPLDQAWEALSNEEKNSFATLYFLRRNKADIGIDKAKEVAKMFNGKIVKVEFNE